MVALKRHCWKFFHGAAGFQFCVEICVVTVTEALHDDVQRVVVSRPQR